jgi:hypothetical protein
MRRRLSVPVALSSSSFPATGRPTHDFWYLARAPVRLMSCYLSRRPRQRTWTAKLLGLASPGVRDEEGPVVRDERLAELERGRGVRVLGRVGDDGAGQGLADGVDLRRVATARHLDADVDALERVPALGRRRGANADEDGLVGLEAEHLRLDQVQRLAVDPDLALAGLAVRDGSGGLSLGLSVSLPCCGMLGSTFFLLRTGQSQPLGNDTRSSHTQRSALIALSTWCLNGLNSWASERQTGIGIAEIALFPLPRLIEYSSAAFP